MELINQENILFKKREVVNPNPVSQDSNHQNQEKKTVKDVYRLEKQIQYFIIMDQFGDSLRIVHDRLIG